jgi:hypothetical protein
MWGKLLRTKGRSGHYLLRGGGGGRLAPKRNVFLGKKFSDPTIKKSIFLPNLKYQLKNKYQKLYKRIPFSCHTCPLPLL